MDNSKLFEKYKLNNNVEVPGRLAVAPMSLFIPAESGKITDEERQYLANHAKGIGLYILGAAVVSEEGIGIKGQPRAFSDKDIPSHVERAKIVKNQGALAICQIVHGGLFANRQYTGKTPLCPSAEIGNKELERTGQLNDDTRNEELTNEDILRIINDFGRATEIALKAGYDGIEIHAANNFLVQQFYSGYYNKRKDEWGGSLEKRIRFPLEIVDSCCKIRDKYNKPEFIIGYRLSPEEPFEDGITMTETLVLVRELIKKPIQYIHVSQKNYFQNARRGEGAGTPRLKLIHDEIKGKVALIGVGGLFTEKDINKALISGYTEFIGVGRASMINRDLATLLKEGKGDKIEVEVDDKHPEDYCFTKGIWAMIHQGMDWLPKIKSQ